MEIKREERSFLYLL